MPLTAFFCIAGDSLRGRSASRTPL